jgi:hypothetical protein
VKYPHRRLANVWQIGLIDGRRQNVHAFTYRRLGVTPLNIRHVPTFAYLFYEPRTFHRYIAVVVLNIVRLCGQSKLKYLSFVTFYVN